MDESGAGPERDGQPVTIDDIKHLLPPGALELMEMAQLVGIYLETLGGKVTDLGYDFPAKRAELVVQAPDGARLEWTVGRVEA